MLKKPEKPKKNRGIVKRAKSLQEKDSKKAVLVKTQSNKELNRIKTSGLLTKVKTPRVSDVGSPKPKLENKTNSDTPSTKTFLFYISGLATDWWNFLKSEKEPTIAKKQQSLTYSGEIASAGPTANRSSAHVQSVPMARIKLRERFLLGLAGSVILLTVFLILDLQMDIGMTGQHLAASHGRVQYSALADGPGAAYNSFRRKFLQKANASKESGASQQTEVPEVGRMQPGGLSSGVRVAESEPHDDFKDLLEFVVVRGGGRGSDSLPVFEHVPNQGVKESNPTLQHVLGLPPR